jgi:hypothetical protein
MLFLPILMRHDFAYGVRIHPKSLRQHAERISLGTEGTYLIDLSPGKFCVWSLFAMPANSNRIPRLEMIPMESASGDRILGVVFNGPHIEMRGIDARGHITAV